MPDAKTKPTKMSVAAHIKAMKGAERQADCRTLAAMMEDVTGAKPVLWGPSIVGFGKYHYKYDSGHQGDSCLIGFASRGARISIYLQAGFEGRTELLAQLGGHQKSVGCLYVKRLADIKLPVLKKLLVSTVKELKARAAKAAEA